MQVRTNKEGTERVSKPTRNNFVNFWKHGSKQNVLTVKTKLSYEKNYRKTLLMCFSKSIPMDICIFKTY